MNRNRTKINTMNKSRKKSIRRTFMSAGGGGTAGCHVQFALLLCCLVLAKCDRTIQNEIDSGSQTHTKNSFTELTGGSIVGEKWLRQAESPYTLQTDLHIERTGRLYIEPGVKVHVAPMVGITVRGILNALVSFVFDKLFFVNIGLLIIGANVHFFGWKKIEFQKPFRISSSLILYFLGLRCCFFFYSCSLRFVKYVFIRMVEEYIPINSM